LINLSEIDFENAILFKIKTFQTSFRNANLSNANMIDAYICDTRESMSTYDNCFENVNITNVNLFDSCLVDVRFSNVNMNHIIFDNSI
jgi:uncharacterized protein YjbI with pentapeptide repeats